MTMLGIGFGIVKKEQSLIDVELKQRGLKPVKVTEETTDKLTDVKRKVTFLVKKKKKSVAKKISNVALNPFEALKPKKLKTSNIQSNLRKRAKGF